MFQNYEYGMKLAGLQNLRVTDTLLSDPDSNLDAMIKKVYGEKNAPQV